MTDILLDINHLTKAYPGVVANNNVSFQIRRGEVPALPGENAAGKSTLVKMIYGLVKPDSGSMTFQDQQFAPTSPNAARSTGKVEWAINWTPARDGFIQSYCNTVPTPL